MSYKKVRTDVINGKKRCIYMKPKGKREYVKSNGEFVLLSAYMKAIQKKYKNKGGMFFANCFGKTCKKPEHNNNVRADLVFAPQELNTEQYQEDQPNDYYVPYNSPRNNKKNEEYYIDRKGNIVWERPENISDYITISIPRTNMRTKK